MTIPGRTRSTTLRVAMFAAWAVVCAGPVAARAGGAKVEAGPAAPSDARPMTPKALEGIDIVDRLGEKVPLDAELTDESGKKVKLGDYFSGGESGKPVVLVLGYYTCPMLCSLVLNSTFEGLQGVDLDMGEDYTVVSISIDPRDTVQIAHDKRETYLRAYKREGAKAGLHFHVADEGEVRRVADAVGFGYRWDEKTEQYAHAAGIFFLSPDGTLTRTLFGLTFEPSDMKFALMEASRGEVGTIVDKVLLSCFTYTADSQKYGVYVFGLFRVGGVLTILFLGTLLFVLWRRERHRAKAGTSAPASSGQG